MDIEGNLSLDEAKRVAIQKDRAPIGQVVAALDTLYKGVRDLENQRDGVLSEKHASWCSCHGTTDKAAPAPEPKS